MVLFLILLGCARPSAGPTLATLRFDPALAEALELPVHRFRLENGLEVVVHPDHRSPLVALHLQVGVGTGDEAPGQAGVAHLFEHLMYEGSARAPEGAYDRLLAEVGGDNNAWTDHDWTAYHLVVPKEALDLALFLEADRMGWLMEGLDRDKLDNQLAVVGGEAAIGRDAPHERDLEAVLASVFPPGHPYHLPVIGISDELVMLGLEDLRSFHSRWYGPGNSTLVVAGDVEPALAEAAVRRYFGPVPGSITPERKLAPMPVIEGEKRTVFVGPVRRSTLYIAFPTVPRGHPDEPALDLLSRILSSGPGSPLDDALIYHRRRVDSVDAWTWNGRHGGLFVVEAGNAEHSLTRVLANLDRQLERLRVEPLPQALLLRHQARFRAEQVRRAESLEARAELLNDCLRTGEEPSCLGADVARVSAVTVADLERVMKQYLGPGRVLVSVVSEEEKDRALPGSIPVELP